MKTTTKERFMRIRKSLRMRLTVAVVFAVATVSAISTLLDYRRERSQLIHRTVASLEDQARTLGLGRGGLSTPEAIDDYVRQFCEALNAHVSPGHIIVLINADGQVLARSSSPQEKGIESALLTAEPERDVVSVGQRTYVTTQLADEDGTTILMAQDLANIDRELGSMLVSHVLSSIVASVAIILLTFFVVHFWAIRPLRQLAEAVKAWAAQRFTVRSALPGPTELHVLTEELHKMAEKLHSHEQRRLADMQRARKIQQNLLPKLDPTERGLKLSGQYWPMEDVAGDLYDVFDLPDGRMVAAVIDIAGHGVSAALLTGVVKMSLRYRLGQTTDLGSALEDVNRDLLACTLAQTFAVACLGIWDASTSTWTCASLGHEGCTIIAAGKVMHVESTGPMLGILPEAQWSAMVIQLQPGDRVFLYTDGVTESGVLGESQLGSEGVRSLLAKSRSETLDEQVKSMIDEVHRRSQGEATDDTAILAFEVAGKPVRVAERCR